nr:immunoglobulin light chain junction region [Macaca mulatta]MOW30191.1 immunoglobulin light chain junction region [Macaca mulatta]
DYYCQVYDGSANMLF